MPEVEVPQKLKFQFERHQALEKQRSIRLRNSADEFAIGALLAFLLIWISVLAGFEVRGGATLPFVATIALVYFGLEWLEVRRIRNLQEEISELFRKQVLLIMADRVYSWD